MPFGGRGAKGVPGIGIAQPLKPDSLSKGAIAARRAAAAGGTLPHAVPERLQRLVTLASIIVRFSRCGGTCRLEASERHSERPAFPADHASQRGSDAQCLGQPFPPQRGRSGQAMRGGSPMPNAHPNRVVGDGPGAWAGARERSGLLSGESRFARAALGSSSSSSSFSRGGGGNAPASVSAAMFVVPVLIGAFFASGGLLAYLKWGRRSVCPLRPPQDVSRRDCECLQCHSK